MKTAFTYHRYSDPRQGQGYTLETQREVTKTLAEKYEAQIIGTYEDKGISGESIEKRPDMMNMLADLSILKPDYIIVMDQDRFSRGDSFWFVKGEMVKCGVCLITEKEGITNFKEDASKDFMSDILAASSKFYIKLLRLKVKRGNVTRANNGLFIGNLTNVFGYDYDKETKNLKINENEATVVKLIFDLYLKGHGFYKISRILNMQGYKTKHRSNFVSSNIQRILSHSLYCGYLYHIGRTIKGVHEPIISESIYSKSLLQKKDNNFRNPRMNIKHLLTGFMFCDNCGARMQVTNGEKGTRQKVKTRSYACSGYFKMECDKSTYIKEHLVEPYIIEQIKNRIKELDIKLKNKKVKNYFDKNKAIEIVDDKLTRTSELYAEGNINKTNKDNLILKYKKEKAEIEKMPEQKYIDLSILKELKAHELWEDLTFERKRKVLSILVNKIIIASGKKSVNYFERINIIWNEL